MHRIQSTLRQLAPSFTMSSTTTSDPVLIDACALYQAAFGVHPKDVTNLIIASAPGRVNLIGEHTDYNDGFVFPCAITFHTIVMGRKNESEEFRLVSSNMLPKLPTPPSTSQSTPIITDDVKLSGAPQKRKADEITPDVEKKVVEEKVDLKNVKPIIFDATSVYQRSTDGAWHNYLRGVLNQYRLAGHMLSGMDIVVCGNVPLGGGLSSSASLEVATATFLDGILGVTTPGPEKALLCQGAEHTFAGVPCGIMDQFVVSNAKEGHALLLDCRSQQFKLVPIDDPDVTILITNSNVKHELTGGEYKSRREQCEEAVRILSQAHPNILALRDATLEQLNAMEEKMDELVFHRARHVITENERTEKAATLLPTRDYTGFGRLMIHSHVSMKNDFEISCQEIDTLVDIALECEGVYGSRMTGGGFGGCTVTLVKTSHVDAVIATIQKQYLERENKHATCFITRPANGTKLITL